MILLPLSQSEVYSSAHLSFFIMFIYISPYFQQNCCRAFSQLFQVLEFESKSKRARARLGPTRPSLWSMVGFQSIGIFLFFINRLNAGIFWNYQTIFLKFTWKFGTESKALFNQCVFTTELALMVSVKWHSRIGWPDNGLKLQWKLGELKRILGELPNRGADTIFPNMNLTGLYV